MSDAFDVSFWKSFWRAARILTAHKYPAPTWYSTGAAICMLCEYVAMSHVVDHLVVDDVSRIAHATSHGDNGGDSGCQLGGCPMHWMMSVQCGTRP